MSIEEYNELKRKHGLAVPTHNPNPSPSAQHTPLSTGKVLPKKPLPKETPKIDPSRIKPGF